MLIKYLPMFRYIISILLIVPSFTMAQNQEKDTTTFSLTSFVPQGIKFGVDGFGLIRTGINPNLTTIEGKAEFDFKKYIGVFETGVYTNTIDSLPKYRYNISGSFFKIGIDANLLHKSEDKSVFTFGLRYGRARQTDKLQYRINDPVYGFTDNLSAVNSKIGGGWVEMVVGLQVEIFNNLYLGYSARYKLGLRFKQQEFVPFEMAGYGRTETVSQKNSTWGFNYYLLYSIQWEGK